MDNNQVVDEGGAINNQNDEFIGRHEFLRKKDARNAVLLKQAHEGVMIEKIQRQNKIAENTVKGLQKQAGYNTSSGSGSQSNTEEDDMGVNIGNESKVENHYHYPQPPEPPKQPQPQVEQPKIETNKPNWMVPASIVAAGALTGAGIYFKDTPSQQPQQVIVEPNKGPMIDTDIGVGFDEPQPIGNIELVPLERNQDKVK